MKHEVEIRYMMLTDDKKDLIVGDWIGCGTFESREKAVGFAEDVESVPNYQARIREAT